MTINNKLLHDITRYCECNNIDCDEFVNKLLKSAFLREKYGEKPNVHNNQIIIEDMKVKDNKVFYKFEQEKPEIQEKEEGVTEKTETPTKKKPKKRTLA